MHSVLKVKHQLTSDTSYNKRRCHHILENALDSSCDANLSKPSLFLVQCKHKTRPLRVSTLSFLTDWLVTSSCYSKQALHKILTEACLFMKTGCSRWTYDKMDSRYSLLLTIKNHLLLKEKGDINLFLTSS